MVIPSASVRLAPGRECAAPTASSASCSSSASWQQGPFHRKAIANYPEAHQRRLIPSIPPTCMSSRTCRVTEIQA